MKKSEKRKLVWVFVLAMLLCTGCGASGGGTKDAMTAETNSAPGASYTMGISEEYVGSESADMAPSAESGRAEISDGRKLIETVNLEVETKEFEELMGVLNGRIQELGGYVEDLDTYNGSSYSGTRGMRSANLTVRIPAGQLDDFINTVSDNGNIVRHSGNIKDVTLSYVDMESRRNTLRTEQSRLLEFLDRAETIEEIITIEERLSEVRYQLESMESQLRALDNQIDFSTIHINISEVQDLTPVVEPTVWKRISEGFGESVADIGDGMLEFGIWFLVHIPYLVIWGIVLALIVLCWRRHRVKKQKKLEERLRTSAPPAPFSHRQEGQQRQDTGEGESGE